MIHLGSYGLIGEKLGHSLSPEIHNRLFQLLDMKGSYSLFEIDKKDIGESIDDLRTLNIKGCNVTIPYKEEIMRYIDFISPEGKAIGAINTIHIKEGKSYGYNTDYFGFGLMLKKFAVDINEKIVVILGAGGAAKAVVQYLLDNEVAQVILVSRNKQEASRKFSKVKIIDYDELKDLQQGDIIINTTPCGMYPKVDTSVVNKDVIAKFKVAIDLIYNPEKTLFLNWAEELDLKAINGLYMLIGQAIKAEEIWNNIKISQAIINEIYEEFVKKSSKK